MIDTIGNFTFFENQVMFCRGAFTELRYEIPKKNEHFGVI